MRGEFDPETGIVRYFDPSEGDERRAAWIEEHAVPALLEAHQGNRTLVEAGLFVVAGGWPHYGYRTRDSVSVGLVPARAGDLARAANWHLQRRNFDLHWGDEELAPLFGAYCEAEPADDDPDRWWAAPTLLARLDVEPGPVVAVTVIAEKLRPWMDGIRWIDAPLRILFPPEEGDERRRAYLETEVAPLVREAFLADPHLRSAAFTVGQYWNDEAHDEVHLELVWSELETPDLSQPNAYYAGIEEPDPVNRPSGFGPDIGLPEHLDTAVPLFACCCHEGGDQNNEPYRNQSCYAVLRRRRHNKVEIEIVGAVIRPWLDGKRGLESGESWSRRQPWDVGYWPGPSGPPGG